MNPLTATGSELAFMTAGHRGHDGDSDEDIQLPVVARPSSSGSDSSSARDHAPAAAAPATLPLANSTPPLLPTASAIVALSAAGVLVRVGLVRLATVDEVAPIFPLLYPQLLGCIIFGVITSTPSQKKTHVGQNQHHQLPPQIKSALTTGLCGSITTFSSLALQCFRLLTSRPPSIDAPFDIRAANSSFSGVLGASGMLLVTVGMGTCGVLFGRGLSVPGFRITASKTLDAVMLVSGPLVLFCAGMALINADFGSDPTRASLALSCLLGPLGSLLRWRVSVALNRAAAASRHTFHRLEFLRSAAGTLVVNVAGSFIIAFAAACVTRWEVSSNSVAGCFLVAISDGFCGCLTTLSTMCGEILALDRMSQRLGYLFLSVVASLVLIGAIYPLSYHS